MMPLCTFRVFAGQIKRSRGEFATEDDHSGRRGNNRFLIGTNTYWVLIRLTLSVCSFYIENSQRFISLRSTLLRVSGCRLRLRHSPSAKQERNSLAKRHGLKTEVARTTQAFFLEIWEGNFDPIWMPLKSLFSFFSLLSQVYLYQICCQLCPWRWITRPDNQALNITETLLFDNSAKNCLESEGLD